MSTDTAITAAILAGGLARRMRGTDKAGLRLNGRRIIELQVAALRHVTDAIVVVGGHPGRFAELNVRAVPDTVAGCGALGGIYSALVADRGETGVRPGPDPGLTLVVACDMPFLRVPLLQRLARPLPAGIDVVMPRTHEGLQPLCAVYAARCANTIRRRIDAGLLKASDVVEDLRVEEIGPDELAAYDPDGLMFVNVNTPHDYERAKDLMGRVPGSREAPGNPITDTAT